MMGISARGGMAALLSILVAAPAVGQAPPRGNIAPPDPNEIICEKQQVLGSRLQSKRVCRTRAEWADLQRQDRQDLEQRQVQKPMKGY